MSSTDSDITVFLHRCSEMVCLGEETERHRVNGFRKNVRPNDTQKLSGALCPFLQKHLGKTKMNPHLLLPKPPKTNKTKKHVKKLMPGIK